MYRDDGTNVAHSYLYAVGDVYAGTILKLTNTAPEVDLGDSDWMKIGELSTVDGTFAAKRELSWLFYSLATQAPIVFGSLLPPELFQMGDWVWPESGREADKVHLCDLDDQLIAGLRTDVSAAEMPQAWRGAEHEVREILRSHASLQMLWAGLNCLLIAVDRPDRRMIGQADAVGHVYLGDFAEQVEIAMTIAIPAEELARLRARARSTVDRLSAELARLRTQ